MIAVWSCSEEIRLVESLDGSYTGIFYRTNPAADYDTASVTLVFEGNSYTGSGGEGYYPAICHGKFILSGKEIEFTNECFWTANFDWSYILSGKFRIVSEGGKIIMTASRGDSAHDVYVLSKDN